MNGTFVIMLMVVMRWKVLVSDGAGGGSVGPWVAAKRGTIKQAASRKAG